MNYNPQPQIDQIQATVDDLRASVRALAAAHRDLEHAVVEAAPEPTASRTAVVSTAYTIAGYRVHVELPAYDSLTGSESLAFDLDRAEREMARMGADRGL